MCKCEVGDGMGGCGLLDHVNFGVDSDPSDVGFVDVMGGQFGGEFADR